MPISPNEWYQKAIAPDFRRADEVRYMQMQHQAQQSPYQQFQSEYPAIDQYARDVVSGRRFAKTIHDTGTLMSQALDSPEALSEAVGMFGVGGMIAGKAAKTANLEMLDIAKGATKKGMSKEKIFDATGWYKGVDDKWRFEIDDSVSKFNQPLFEDAVREGLKPQSRRLLEHPELIKNYPQSSYPVKAIKGESGAAFYPVGKRIDMGAYGGGRKTLSHELQHGIQNIEDFSRGGSPRAIQKDMDNALDALRQEAGDMSHGRVPYNEQRMQELISMQDEIYNIDSVTAYKRLAGEVEARNVQTRLNLKPDDRRMLAPWLTEDVPTNKQTVGY